MNTTMLVSNVNSIDEIERQLSALREQYATRPQLLEIYAQPFNYRLEQLRKSVRAAVVDESEQADFWIKLRGPSIGAGFGSLEVITAFMERFRIAAKHAVSATLGVDYVGGRFSSEVEAAASFQLSATAPGSFQLGLSRPIPTAANELSNDMFGAESVADVVNRTMRSQELGMEGVQILLLALQAATDDDALEELQARLSTHGTLRVLFHARALFPKGIDGVEFRGRSLGSPMAFPVTTRDRLREIGEQLVQAERYIEGVGVLAMLDLANRSVRLDHASVFEIPTFNRVSAEFSAELEDKVLDYAGRLVSFTGTLRFDEKGVPQVVRLDYLDPLEGDSADED